MTISLVGPATGRPRKFDSEVVLEAALQVFWRHGYTATSLDDLTAAMGLSRSSFYGAFGSKHDVLLAAVERYVDRIFTSFQAIAAAEPDALAAVRAIVDAAANPRPGEQGCLLVNSIAELAPDDEAVRQLAGMHIDRVIQLLARLLVGAGHPATVAADLAGAALSCAFGATTLRKAGMPEAAVAGLVRQVDGLLALAGA